MRAYVRVHVCAKNRKHVETTPRRVLSQTCEGHTQHFVGTSFSLLILGKNKDSFRTTYRTEICSHEVGLHLSHGIAYLIHVKSFEVGQRDLYDTPRHDTTRTFLGCGMPFEVCWRRGGAAGAASKTPPPGRCKEYSE